MRKPKRSKVTQLFCGCIRTAVLQKTYPGAVMNVAAESKVARVCFLQGPRCLRLWPLVCAFEIPRLPHYRITAPLDSQENCC